MFHSLISSARARALLAVAALAVGSVLALPAAAGTDVAVGQTGNEPTNAVVNPRNPAQVAVMRGCQVRVSNDFGQTFPVLRNTTIAVCNGDATMAYDSQGRLFVSHLTTIGGELLVFAGQVADTTTAGTLTYTPVQVSVTNGNGDDKQWLAADSNAASPYRDNLYLVWTEFASPTRILFSRSTDSGANWSAPTQLSVAGEGFVWPSHLAVARNGDLYVAYHTVTCGAANSGTVPLLRDGSGGANFAAGTVPQRTTAFGAGQATVTCNVQDASGDEVPGAQFWLQGTVQPWILPDPARPGNVYVVGNDDPDDNFAAGDAADVVIARSSDHGLTFTTGRVDHAPGTTFAVMPTAAIDQDGVITVAWYDNRRGLRNTGANANNGTANFLLDLYGTASTDGGIAFANDFRVSDSPFDPDVNAPCRFGALATNNCTGRIGEYNGLASVDGLGYATWSGNTNPPAAPFPADGAGGQRTLFDLFSGLGRFPDRFEPNESRDAAVAAGLGAGQTYAERRLTLHEHDDADVFRVTALFTGVLTAQITYNDVVATPRLRVLDEGGNSLGAPSVTQLRPGTSLASLPLPAVQGQRYFVEIDNPAGAAAAAPQSTYDLAVVSRSAPAPFGLDLQTASDTGRSDSDNVTADATPTLDLRLDDAVFTGSGVGFSPTPDAVLADDSPGFKLAVYAEGTLVGYPTPVAGSPGSYRLTLTSPLPDGVRTMTARVLVVDPTDTAAAGTAHAVGQGPESGALVLTVDTTAPAAPLKPDLLAASDTGGISTDDVTTTTMPSFSGTAETNSLVRLFANGVDVGQATTGTDATDGATGNGLGRFQLTADALDDAVYAITATGEDLAGNISAASPALTLVVAHRQLNLTGAFAATGPVTVDLATETLAPFPVPGGVVGVRGIPTVVVDSAGQSVNVLGTPGDDGLAFRPTGASSAVLTRSGSAQVLDLGGIGGTLTADPLAGTDTVTVEGTTNAEQITGQVSTTTTVAVDGLQVVALPINRVETLAIVAGSGADVVDLSVTDAVSAVLSVDSGDPGVIKPVGDELKVRAVSPGGRERNAPGAKEAGSGSVFVSYPRTTGAETRVDYRRTERVTLR